MKLSTLAGLLAPLFLARFAAADTITGTVIDSNGAPVAGVNIDAIRISNGNNINISNDGTNAAGAFVTTIPADVYDLYFFPPAPPANSHVTLVVRNVVVVGTKNLGTLQLRAGSLVSGRVQDQGGVPIAQVDIVMTDQATGQEVPLQVHRTNAFGNFLVAAPRNAITLALHPANLPPQLLAPRRIDLTSVGDTNMGNLVLQQGFLVAGHVQRASNGLAVPGVDLDFKNVLTGTKLYTPSDNTNPLGDYSVVVPAGTYDVDFAAPAANLLGGKRLPDEVVTANRTLSTVSLAPGAVLSGTIRSFDNVIQVGADVDVYSEATGELFPTPGDNTNAAGAYSVIVPRDNLRVLFRPPSFTVPLVSEVHTNVLLTSATTLNGFLPAWPAPDSYGVGLAGTGGVVPHLGVTGGTARSGNSSFTFDMQGGRGGAFGVLQVSVYSASLPFKGGRLLIRPGSYCSVKTLVHMGGTPGAAGAGSQLLPTFFPLSLGEGYDLYAQFRLIDPGAPQGVSLSDAVHFRVYP